MLGKLINIWSQLIGHKKFVDFHEALAILITKLSILAI